MSFGVKLEIVRLLKEARGYMMPEPAILNQMAVRHRPPATATEIRTAIRDLEANLKIIGVTGEDGVARYKATTAGKAMLAEAELV